MCVQTLSLDKASFTVSSRNPLIDTERHDTDNNSNKRRKVKGNDSHENENENENGSESESEENLEMDEEDPWMGLSVWADKLADENFQSSSKTIQEDSHDYNEEIDPYSQPQVSAVPLWAEKTNPHLWFEEGLKKTVVNPTSFDSYYISSNSVEKVHKSEVAQLTIKHSLPASRLELFQTFHSLDSLRNLHRPKMTLPPRPRNSEYRAIFNVFPANSTSMNPENDEFAERDAPEKVSQLTARCGRLLVVEYAQENPPVLSCVGMCSGMRNYVCSKDPPANFEDGQMYPINKKTESPFQIELNRGEHIRRSDCCCFFSHSFSIFHFFFLLVLKTIFTEHLLWTTHKI